MPLNILYHCFCLHNILLYGHTILWASLVAQMVKNLPTMWETWVQSLDWEDPLEKRVATRFNMLAWEIPWKDREAW